MNTGGNINFVIYKTDQTDLINDAPWFQDN